MSTTRISSDQKQNGITAEELVAIFDIGPFEDKDGLVKFKQKMGEEKESAEIISDREAKNKEEWLAAFNRDESEAAAAVKRAQTKWIEENKKQNESKTVDLAQQNKKTTPVTFPGVPGLEHTGFKDVLEELNQVSPEFSKVRGMVAWDFDEVLNCNGLLEVTCRRSKREKGQYHSSIAYEQISKTKDPMAIEERYQDILIPHTPLFRLIVRILGENGVYSFLLSDRNTYYQTEDRSERGQESGNVDSNPEGIKRADCHRAVETVFQKEKKYFLTPLSKLVGAAAHLKYEDKKAKRYMLDCALALMQKFSSELKKTDCTSIDDDSRVGDDITAKKDENELSYNFILCPAGRNGDRDAPFHWIKLLRTYLSDEQLEAALIRHSTASLPEDSELRDAAKYLWFLQNPVKASKDIKNWEGIVNKYSIAGKGLNEKIEKLIDYQFEKELTSLQEKMKDDLNITFIDSLKVLKTEILKELHFVIHESPKDFAASPAAQTADKIIDVMRHLTAGRVSASDEIFKELQSLVVIGLNQKVQKLLRLQFRSELNALQETMKGDINKKPFIESLETLEKEISTGLNDVINKKNPKDFLASPAAQTADKTINMMRRLRAVRVVAPDEMIKQSQSLAVIKQYEQQCRPSAWRPFFKAVGWVIITGVFAIAGGVALGAICGAAGLGNPITALGGLLAGTITGTAIGMAAGTAAFGITAATVSGALLLKSGRKEQAENIWKKKEYVAAAHGMKLFQPQPKTEVKAHESKNEKTKQPVKPVFLNKLHN